MADNKTFTPDGSDEDIDEYFNSPAEDPVNNKPAESRPYYVGNVECFPVSDEGYQIFGQDCRVSANPRETGLNNNDIIISASGGGKTGSVLLPNIASAAGSMVIADCKHTLSDMLTPHLKEKGYNVYTVDFVSPECGTSSYNPLSYIRYDKKKGTYNELDIMNLCSALIPSSVCSHDQFWPVAAQNFLACAIAYVLEMFDGSDRNLCSVLEVFKVMSAGVSPNGKSEMPFLDILALENPDSFAARKYKSFKSVLCADRTSGCILQFVSNALSMFEFNEGKELFGGKDPIDFTELASRKTAVFLNTSSVDCALHPLVSVFYTQLFSALMRFANDNKGSLPVPVRIFMDDFASSVTVPNFTNIISVIRSYRISVTLLLQTISQLDSMYSPSEANTILGNCDHQLFIGAPADLKTIDYIAARTNKLPERIMHLGIDEEVLLERGKPARFIKRIEPYSTYLYQPLDEASRLYQEDFEKYAEEYYPF